MKASEGLFFFKEQAFKNVLFILLGVLGFLLLIGIVWELLYHRPKRRKGFVFSFNEIYMFYKPQFSSSVMPQMGITEEL